MNDHTLQVLEYDKLREIVARFAASGPGIRAVESILPLSEPEQVGRLLGETREFLALLDRGESPQFDGIRDIEPQLGKLSAAGMALAPSELLAVASTLAAGRSAKRFFQRSAEPAMPFLSAYADRIIPLKQVEDSVNAAIDEKGEVKDSASPELRRVRKLIGRTRDEILDRLSRILKTGADEHVVQDEVITLRDDRYVVPLKPNFRQSIKGVVHGQSGSRATLFVEPLGVLEQNNRLAELRMEERDEIDRILRKLTSFIAGHAVEIEASFSALVSLDAVHARARFGMAVHGVVPEVSAARRMRLRAARHPLLVWKLTGSKRIGEVAPNDLDLGTEAHALIISGPNTGGKTVMLKTAGLLCLMAQSGIPVTAGEGTELPVFGSVHADIGDEQSLDQDLSTFSSHMRQVADILTQAGRGSLVLLDELGGGTDPAEGAALGEAVLSELLSRGCMIVVTTHLGNLKLFGSRTSGAVNAAMEFDPATLRPTYRILPGRPGRSYGLDMAARLGVTDTVIRDARTRMGEHDARLDRLLEQIEIESRELERLRKDAEQDRSSAANTREEAATELRAAREEARRLKEKARGDVRDVLHALRQKLKELSRAPERSAAAAAQERAEVESLAARIEPDEALRELIPVPGREYRPGERVRVPRLRKSGTIVIAHKGVLEIEVGGKTLKLSASEVAPLEAGAEKPQRSVSSGWSAELGEGPGIADRLNLLGLRVDEAVAETERFLDRAGMNNLSSVTIIHGLGTGALKTAVAEFLKQHPLIASFRTGEPAEGGAGVTVAELKR